MPRRPEDSWFKEGRVSHPERDRSAASARHRRGGVAAGFAVLGLIAFADGGGAQLRERTLSEETGFEVRPFVGIYVPTGEQKNQVRAAQLAGMQLSLRAVPAFAITGTFGWSPAEDQITRVDETLDLFQYDLGVEARAPELFASMSTEFSPFIGLGAGARTYIYRDLDVGARTNFAGYGALGGDIIFGSVGLRIEGRDYISHFQALDHSGGTDTRNDMVFTGAISFRF